jgi:hypothetical protein
MAVIAFQVFIKQTVVIARRNLNMPNVIKSSFVEGMYFSDCKNETKKLRDVFCSW